MIEVTGDFPNEMEPGVDSQIRGLGDSLGNAHVDINNISNFLNQFSVEQIDTLDGKRLHILAQILGTGETFSSVVPPLQIINGSETGKFSITDGSVNSQSPTLGGVPIAGYPLANPVVPPPEFTVTANTYVWIKVVGVFGVFGSPTTHTITIETDTAGSGLGDPPAGTAISATGFTSFYYIGEVLSPPTYRISNWHSGGNVAVLSWGLYNVWGRA